MNYWDIALIFLLLFGAWAGWRLKSLPLLGLGFAFALAPLAARAWAPDLGKFLVAQLGAKGLQGHQQAFAYWIILAAAAVAIFYAFGALSSVFKALQLGTLDRAFGAFMICATILAILSLNLRAWSFKLEPSWRSSLESSYSWGALHPQSAPRWAEKVEQSLPSMPKIEIESAGHSRKKAAHR